MGQNHSHICIPCCNHLSDFPNAINKGRLVVGGEPKFMSDAIEAILGHVLPQMEGAWILVFVMRDQISKIFLCKAKGWCNQEPQTNVAKEFDFFEFCYTFGSKSL